MRWLFLFFLTLHSHADDSRLSTSITLRGEGGGEDYHLVELLMNHDFDDTWTGEANVKQAQQRGSGATADLRAGIGARFWDPLNLRTSFSYTKEPNRIRGIGFSLGGDWTANSRTESEHETIFHFDYARYSYYQKGTEQPFPPEFLGRRFIREEWTLEWEQEVFESFRTFVFGSLNSYGSSPGNQVNTTTDFRPRRVSRSRAGILKGFPLHSFGLGTRFSLSEDWRGAFEVSRAKIVYQSEEATTIAPELSVQVETDWWLSLGSSYVSQSFRESVLSFGAGITHDF